MSNHDLNHFIDCLEESIVYQQAVELCQLTESRHRSSIVVNDIKFGYLDFGAKHHTALIWCHASCLTGYEILNVQKGLVDQGYRVIAIDYRGHGKTQIDITDYNTSLYHIADDINALLDHLSIERAIVGGFSKGGWVATAFYDAYPHRVLGLLLEDGGSFSYLQMNEEIEQGESIAVCPYPEAIGDRLYDPEAVFNKRIDLVKLSLEFFGQVIRAYSNPEFIAMMISLCRRNTGGDWVFHCQYKRLMLKDPDKHVPALSKLPLMQKSQELMLPVQIFRKLHVPLFIIDPVSKETELPVSHQNAELKALHPSLVTHDIYRYGYSPHAAHLQRPDRFLQSASELLEQVNHNLR